MQVRQSNHTSILTSAIWYSLGFLLEILYPKGIYFLVEIISSFLSFKIILLLIR